MSEITQQLRARCQAFRARSLAEVRLLVLLLDVTYLATRPSGPKEGVLVAGATTRTGAGCCSTWSWASGTATTTGWRWVGR